MVAAAAEPVYIRANQVGYDLKAPKIAMAFSKERLPGDFRLVEVEAPRRDTTGQLPPRPKGWTPNKDRNPDTPSVDFGGTRAWAPPREGRVVFEGRTRLITNTIWGRFEHHAELDFSGFRRSGFYVIRLGKAASLPIEISSRPLARLPGQMLEFMREQRCGYNPWLDAECHQFDGRTAYGPLTNGSFVDARGGWHDAGDLLKYLLTSGNATAQMLLAWELGKGKGSRPLAEDRFNALGKPGANGIPDLLDETRWGLDWMLKLHPAPDQLYHQVADDRDHIGRRLPQNEIADYGWGKGSYRVVYFADGKPQGLQQYKSESTGVANLAGRYAAAMALAYQVWRNDPDQRDFAKRCLQAGKEVYALGRTKEGVQQGNSYKAPYRYEETTWADDMEWGAAELHRATQEKSYLEDALRYASLAGAESWMGREQTGHYQFFPYLNLGHFRLHDQVKRSERAKLAAYYRDGLEKCHQAGEGNPYRAGVPFIWCSANLSVALATQCALYERMTGDRQFREFGAKQRDWLLGRNPWGYTLFTGVGQYYSRHPHLMTTEITGREIRGGLLDGPVYERIFKSLKGVSITEPDPLAEFQGPAVYHDDFQDYSTNEPIMDGTAAAILLWTLTE
jgi:hypothetical protein